MANGQWNNRIMSYAEARVADLVACPLNWRIHPENQQDALADTIDEVGFAKPILVQHGTDMVIDGHLRVTLAMRQNQYTIPAIYLDVDDSEAHRLLQVLDPLSGLAITARDKYLELIESTPKPKSEALLALIAQTYHDQQAGVAKQDEQIAQPDDGQSGRLQQCPHCGMSF